MEINIEKLIKVVRKHHLVYDTSNKEYYDRFKKKAVWEHVCQTLNPNYDTCGEVTKLIYYKEVQKKWQSLRDSFRRELINQKTPTTNGKKKAKYRYFDALEFLTPYTHILPAYRRDDPETDTENSSNSKDPLEVFEPLRKRTLSSAFGEDTIVSKEEPQEQSSNVSRRFIDDDEAFLLSLLPSFKEYSLEQKYLLRIEVMKTILKFKQSQKNVVKEEICNDNDDDFSQNDD